MSIIHSIANNLRKTPLFIPARSAYSLLDVRLRTSRRTELADLVTIETKCGDALQSSLSPIPGPCKSVLILGMNRVRYIAMESVVRKSFELAGYTCNVIVPQDGVVVKAYRQLGSDKLVYMDRHLVAMPTQGSAILAGCTSISDVISLCVDGVHCGKFAVSTLMRKTRSGSFDFSDPSIIEDLTGALNRSLQYTRTAQALFSSFMPDALVLVDRGYSPSGEFFDTAIKNGIPVFTWNATHRNDSLMLKRYTRDNQDVHPSSLSNQTWTQIQALSWNEDYSKRVLIELERCYKSGEWYGEVGTQFNKKLIDKSDLIGQLGLDPGRKTAGIFPHIFWDATFFWGTDLFENYEEWFIETLKAACKNTALNWVVKVHPANLVKNFRDGVSTEHSEITTILSEIGELPPHVKLLEADTEFSTLSLLKVIDACVTVRGSVGIEAACLGVPVLTAGTGRYDGLGFTLDSRSREEFLAGLAKLQFAEPLTPAQTLLALKYAWGVFIGRPASLKLLSMRYCNTKAADLEIEYHIQNTQDLRQSSDLIAISDWIRSDNEDFMDWLAN